MTKQTIRNLKSAIRNLFSTEDIESEPELLTRRPFYPNGTDGAKPLTALGTILSAGIAPA
jgi:hypothetical protein